MVYMVTLGGTKDNPIVPNRVTPSHRGGVGATLATETHRILKIKIFLPLINFFTNLAYAYLTKNINHQIILLNQI